MTPNTPAWWPSRCLTLAATLMHSQHDLRADFVGGFWHCLPGLVKRPPARASSCGSERNLKRQAFPRLAMDRRCESTISFAESLGLGRGVTGYTYHTVPVAIHAWLSSPKNFRQAVTVTIQCGGDADTTAAIVGGIVGAGVGQDGIPKDWLDGIWEWPRSVSWMQRLGGALADSLDNNKVAKSPTINPIAVVFRNMLFLFVVLFHGFRRLAPPY